MKITSVDVFLLKFKRQKPIVCRINTDEGIYGWGEAGIAYGVGQHAAYGMVCDLAKLIIGKDPLDNEVIWEDLMKSTFWGQTTGPIIDAGISAIDIALMDIKGKFFNVPVYKLLGGKHNDGLRTYASQIHMGWADQEFRHGSVESYAEICEYAMSKGFDAVKIDFSAYNTEALKTSRKDYEGILTKQSLDLVEDRLRIIRERCGDDLDIIVENHCRTDLTSAIQIGELCDKYRCFAYEEAVDVMNVDQFKILRSKVKTPLASGERIFTRWGYMNFFKNDAIQLAQPDLCTCGGISEAKKIADMAHTFDVKIQAHVAGSPISVAAALQLEATIPNFCIHEHHLANQMKDVCDSCKYDYQPVDGKFYIPDVPGIGNEVKEETLQNNTLVHELIDEPMIIKK